MNMPMHMFLIAWGDPTPKNQGRVTISPFAHIDPLGFIMQVSVSLWLWQAGHDQSKQP